MTAAPDPNTFLLGAPKCGTTAIARYLGATPGVCMSSRKEPNFFCQELHPTKRRYDSYEQYRDRYFSHATPDCSVIAEASTLNLYSKKAVPAILERCHDPRFLVMLRDPVFMANSLFAQRCSNGVETRKDFAEAFWASVDTEKSEDGKSTFNNRDYAGICRLGEQVDRLLQQVPRDRVFFGLMEDLGDRPEELWENLISFLGLASNERDEFPTYNPRRKVPKRTLGIPIRAHLIRFFNRPPPLVQKIRSKLPLGKLGFRDRVVGALRSKGGQLKVDPTFLRELNDYYAADVSLLAERIGRDLSGWLQSGD